MKKLELAYLPGDEVYVRGQDRTCFIENVNIRKIDKADGTFTIEVTYEWYNLDVGIDCTEVWDDGYFTEDDVGKTVFDSMTELEKAWPDHYDFRYEG